MVVGDEQSSRNNKLRNLWRLHKADKQEQDECQVKDKPLAEAYDLAAFVGHEGPPETQLGCMSRSCTLIEAVTCCSVLLQFK